MHSKKNNELIVQPPHKIHQHQSTVSIAISTSAYCSLYFVIFFPPSKCNHILTYKEIVEFYLNKTNPISDQKLVINEFSFDFRFR